MFLGRINKPCPQVSPNIPCYLELWSVLQIRRGKRDNLGIIFHLTPLKRMLHPIMVRRF